MKENTVFADAFNFLLYHGENVIQPQTLSELDTTEVVIPFTVDDKGKKQAQADIHYAMPVRNVIYDALQYGRQVTEISKRNRKNGGQAGSEFMSGFQKEDKLIPVITLVIHFGADKWDVSGKC